MQYPHWQYYLSLVDDLDRLSRYVELAEDNYATYSTELTRILLAAGSEVDVVAKLHCARVTPDATPSTIVDYGNILLPAYPGVTSVEVSIPRCRLGFKPWSEWTTTDRPSWWGSYNKVKHERHTHFRQANLGNVLQAVAGLCVLVSYLHYDDFVSSGLATRRPFFYLDAKYNEGGNVLFAPKTQLPDFATQASSSNSK